MAQKAERIERLIADELGACCEADVADRLDSLRAYRSEIPARSDADLTALKALGNDTRHTIVRLLNAADRELCVCEINPVVDVSDSAISHALSDLYDAGLVARRKEGTWRYYEPTDRAEALLAALDETREGDR
ncbi:MAG: metalloregulator ArsR/SmtB family transcription factor [Natronomonas sp.]|uniref:Winged helix-turn-helix transcriptional regulator n=1 Tax=Natronomonas salsuginis TaxID=2217661 RepID=A0A4U5J7R5_9EURY|nr:MULTISPECIES: metalloregulator ArsR/SmtB family transcription factor [Natronomonas]MDR9380536.1 metalloregulator ArsR/SmtB family transcription factor [Natronomonas sp.]MDR9431954.1 metalloregulator ArsR/SmtB family transcription factor [Natronomonas sp.]TKR24455.1 winged helix-turn-helix transcriptional regulator [Natronomonas salsuginis]